MNRVRWTAGNARGVAHAHVSGRPLCHVQAIAERHAWPELTRCPDCFRAAEALRLQSSGRVVSAPCSFHARPAITGTPGGPAARESLNREVTP